MPKLIDHDKRREAIAEATWQVIVRDGISGVSIRSVAAEAGISTGSLRHSFPSRSELLVHALEMVEKRATARIQTHLHEPDPVVFAQKVIEEMMPLDDERRVEMAVTVALIAESPADPMVRQLRDDTYSIIRDATVGIVDHLITSGCARADVDIEATATTLHALIDGLSLHLLINPDPAFPDLVRGQIRAFIQSLA